MERIKYIIMFFLLALAGAGWTFLIYWGGHFRSISDAIGGPASIIMGIGGFFYQIYMLIYDARHRGETSPADSATKSTT